MSETALEAVLRRDRYVVIGALLSLTALAWAYVLWLAGHMAVPAAGQSMPGMNMDAAMAPAIGPWTLDYLVLNFVMWAVMMVGMMTPSVSPVILLYARVGRHAETQGQPFAAAGWFAAGYLSVWTSFALVATGAQAALVAAALLTPMLTGTSVLAGGVVLIAAGAYQWSPLKYACLAQCQAPLLFIQRHGGFRRQASGSFGLGLRHGLYCVGCCWALMALLFVGGVMNVLWIAGIAVLVLLEKILPGAQRFSRVTGLALMAGGIFLVYQGLLPA